ncbi:periplasmic amidohydrolase [Alishewanella longhuensis]
MIDASGMHLTPGIIDERSHIATEQGVNEGSHANTAEVHLGDVINPDDINIYRALAGGVTAVQVLHGSANPIGGQAQILSLRWGQVAEGLKFKAAPPSIKFALGENVKQSNWGTEFNSRYPQSRIGVETFIRDQFQAAKEYQAAWQAYNKLSKREQGRVAPPRRDYQLDTLVEILEGKRHIHTHSYVASEILMLMQVADEMGFKVNTYTHILEGYKVASEMKAHGASVSYLCRLVGL